MPRRQVLTDRQRSSLFDHLQALELDRDILANVPPHRVARLRRQGERYFAGDLRDISGDRRLAILAVCALEWRSAIADVVVETHDRIVGKTWREAKSRCDARMDDAKSALKDTLQSFATLGSALLDAHEDRVSLEEAVGNAGGWISLKELVATAAQLTDTFAADPLAHVGHGYHRFRRYAPRMLRALDICAAPVAEGDYAEAFDPWRLSDALLDEFAIGGRSEIDADPEKPVERASHVAPSVPSKYELIEVSLDMALSE